MNLILIFFLGKGRIYSIKLFDIVGLDCNVKIKMLL